MLEFHFSVKLLENLLGTHHIKAWSCEEEGSHEPSFIGDRAWVTERSKDGGWSVRPRENPCPSRRGRVLLVPWSINRIMDRIIKRTRSSWAEVAQLWGWSWRKNINRSREGRLKPITRVFINSFFYYKRETNLESKSTNFTIRIIMSWDIFFKVSPLYISLGQFLNIYWRIIFDRLQTICKSI